MLPSVPVELFAVGTPVGADILKLRTIKSRNVPAVFPSFTSRTPAEFLTIPQSMVFLLDVLFDQVIPLFEKKFRHFTALPPQPVVHISIPIAGKLI